MACGNCNTCDVSEKRGCGTSSVFNWLYQIESVDKNNRKLVEVQFKGDRKDFFTNSDDLNISVGDWIAVQAEKSGHDIGKITMIGELVQLQIKRKNRDIKKEPLRKIYRIVEEKELKKWTELIKKENEILETANRIIQQHKLEMKLSDIEFQADNTKATFFYTADKRVDFRGLIKDYSKEFKIRIEMKQIGVRQEAAKIGGLGSCGRELCCSTWMTEFPSVSTSAARYQQLSINPQKISGQCGRLKCCLNFELDTYTEAVRQFPSSKIKLKFKKGETRFAKLDVFKQKMYYFYLNAPMEIFELHLNSVKQIIELNKAGKYPEKIEEFLIPEEEKNISFKDGIEGGSVNRFDNKKKKKRFKKKMVK